MSTPLADIRVIDFTHVLAGPACAYYLGLLGAEVIKVERPPRGEAMRHRGGSDAARAADGMSTAYLTQAAGKRSVTLDLEDPGDRERFEQLLSSADVLVENHRPVTLKRLGLDADSLARRHPRLIHCAMTGYGRGHTLEDAPAYDLNIQAASGLMALTGTIESGPMRVGAPVIDYGTALAAALGVLAALQHRHRTGAAVSVDVSMLDTAFTLMSSTLVDHALTGHVPIARGNVPNSRSAVAGIYRCCSGLLSLGVNEDAQFARLAAVLGHPEWADDPRFASDAARRTHSSEIVSAIEPIFLEDDAANWECRLLSASVPAARVRTLEEAAEVDPGRAFLDHSTGTPTPGLPFRLGSQQAVPARPAETVGASNDLLDRTTGS